MSAVFLSESRYARETIVPDEPDSDLRVSLPLLSGCCIDDDNDDVIEDIAASITPNA